MNMTEAMYYVGLKEAVIYLAAALAVIVLVNAFVRYRANGLMRNAENQKALVPKGYWMLALLLAASYLVLPSKEAIAVSVYNANRDTIEEMAMSPVGNGIYNKMVQKLEISPVKVRDLELIRPTGATKDSLPAVSSAPVEAEASESANAGASEASGI